MCSLGVGIGVKALGSNGSEASFGPRLVAIRPMQAFMSPKTQMKKRNSN